MKFALFLKKYGFNADFFKTGGKINFGLWMKDAKYSVLIQRFSNERVSASLLEDDVSFYNPVFKFNSTKRTIVMDFDEFLRKWDILEDDVLNDRAIPYWKKPFVIWEKMEDKR